MTKTLLAVAIAGLVAGAVVTHASDPMAVYAKIDRVVLEPNADAPTAIQIWGAFSIAQPNNRNDYQAPARGYLYYALPAAKPDLARREWTDLKSLAGTGEIVAFGSRFDSAPRLRPANEKPAAPDPYSLNFGLSKIRGRDAYAPVRALLDFSR